MVGTTRKKYCLKQWVILLSYHHSACTTDRVSALTNPGTNNKNIDTNAIVNAAEPNQSMNRVSLILTSMLPCGP